MRIELDQLRVQQPCPKSWNELHGDDTKRFCDECGLHVHNLSAMSGDEVQKLVNGASGRLCVGYMPTETGTPRVLDYQPEPNTRKRNRRWILGSSLVALFVAAFQTIAFARKPAPTTMMLMGEMGPTPQTTTTQPAVMGKIAPPTSQPIPPPSTQPMEPTVLGDICPPAPATMPSPPPTK